MEDLHDDANRDPFRDCLFLTGPTASGKTAVGIEVACRLNAEIVAMDSMTLYRGLDIGTAKPNFDERRRVPHHLLDVLEPTESASLDWYLTQAKSVCESIRSRGKTPLFVGGTPLYLKACLRGIFAGPPADMELRNQLEQEAKVRGTPHLHARLKQIDPKAAERIAAGDLRRIVRALEVFELTGTPISQLQTQFDRPSPTPPKVVCLVRPRAELYDRINRRVLEMIKQGWVEEVIGLRERGIQLGTQAAQAAGYKEILKFLEGNLEYNRMVELIQTRTRQLAKRQMTWFRHIEECQMLEIHGDDVSTVAERTCDIFEQR